MRMEIIPTKVAAKKVMRPRPSPIRSDANQPRLPSGTPNKVPLPVSSRILCEVRICPCCDACVIPVEYCLMAEGVQSGLVQATQGAREAPVQRASNGINYAAYGDIRLEERELQRMVEAVPASVAAALNRKAYYFVPLAMSESRSPVSGASGT